MFNYSSRTSIIKTAIISHSLDVLCEFINASSLYALLVVERSFYLNAEMLSVASLSNKKIDDVSKYLLRPLFSVPT